MSAWPQITVAVWLMISVSVALWATARPARGWLVLTTKQQRLASFGFAAAAFSEAGLLWAGGFFQGVL